MSFLVDRGAVYPIVQTEFLARLGIRPHRKRSFHLTDAQRLEHPIGHAYFEYHNVGRVAPVVFGKSGDANLFGTTTLEALELVLDLFKRELRPLTLRLMGFPG